VDERLSVRPNGRTETTEAERWPRSVVVFAVGASIVALNLALSLSGDAPGRSVIDRIAGPSLAIAAAVTAVALSRRAGRVPGLVALLAGAVVASAGVGDTGLHLVKLGLAETSYTGLAALAAGLTLLGLGAVLLLSGVKGWRRILAIPVGALLYFYLMSPLAVAVYVTHVPRTPLAGRTPADLGMPYREVTMRAADGVELAGWYVPSRNGAAVAVLHGSGSNRSNMIDHLAVLARHGYGVLAFDARGHGLSGGVAMDLGWNGALDVGAAVSFLSRQPDVEPGRIAVLGVSMGGVGALTAAASDPRISAVISEGAGVATFADAVSVGPEGWPSLPFFGVRHLAADLMSTAPDPIALEDAMARIAPRPVLLIAGRGSTERALNGLYHSVSPSTTQLWELPDTPHSKAIWEHRGEWTSRVVGFLDSVLLEDSAG
jgi:uncharacterized protein